MLHLHYDHCLRITSPLPTIKGYSKQLSESLLRFLALASRINCRSLSLLCQLWPSMTISVVVYTTKSALFLNTVAIPWECLGLLLWNPLWWAWLLCMLSISGSKAFTDCLLWVQVFTTYLTHQYPFALLIGYLGLFHFTFILKLLESPLPKFFDCTKPASGQWDSALRGKTWCAVAIASRTRCRPTWGRSSHLLRICWFKSIHFYTTARELGILSSNVRHCHL